VVNVAICKTITIAAPTPLSVTALELVYVEAANSVTATVTIAGEGYGNLKMTWGSEGVENTNGLGAGTYTLGHWLPPGTHEVCAEMV